jgi:hypothetical protein
VLTVAGDQLANLRLAHKHCNQARNKWPLRREEIRASLRRALAREIVAIETFLAK